MKNYSLSIPSSSSQQIISYYYVVVNSYHYDYHYYVNVMIFVEMIVLMIVYYDLSYVQNLLYSSYWLLMMPCILGLFLVNCCIIHLLLQSMAVYSVLLNISPCHWQSLQGLIRILFLIAACITTLLG